ncbi:MAG: septal ring lytic transglycosylase RlpA family protein [Syntrophaceae bacterium]|nr:septal ring lytic transglycosylase RlpA family protein [Syntrophaceae bacterium]
MKSRRKNSQLFLSLVVLCLFVGCQSLAQYYMPNGAEGVARYYAKRYHGKKTTSGEIYDSKKMTAAHPTLPLGTRVKVVNLDNNKSVIVKINDRCLEHEDVFIDLSHQAARKIGMIKKGKANVRISVVN